MPRGRNRGDDNEVTILVSGATATHLRYASTGRFGHLKTPRNGNAPLGFAERGLLWACDNDAYAAWDEGRFRRMLASVSSLPDRGRLLWVACPDVVADATATLARFDAWEPAIAAAGLPVALVGQDGMEDAELPWDRMEALFVGGSTRWKLSHAALDLAAEAKRRGKLVHVGRVNTLRRLRTVWDWGCVDTIDGSCFSKWPDKFFPWFLRHLAALERQPLLKGIGA
jgi:hypothetical protein